MAEPLKRHIWCESFDSSLASLGALNKAQEVCRTKGFAHFYMDALSTLLAPACIFPCKVTGWWTATCSSLCGPGTAGPLKQRYRVLVGCAQPSGLAEFSTSPSDDSFTMGLQA